MKTKDLENMLNPPADSKITWTRKNALSTGSTLLNLACTGKPHCGFPKGKYIYLVGDSASGKTFLSLTCFAEATLNKHFKEYRLIYDNAEDGALMDVQRYFGKGVARRMEPPSNVDGEPMYSTTIEEFYFHVDDAINHGQPFIYVLDSMDSVSSKEEKAKFEETKKAHRKGKVAAGAYGDGKAKKNSANLRKLMDPLKQTGSILIIISQTRDNLGFGFKKKSRSGGHALRFYACLEIWSSIGGRIKKTVKGKIRTIGIKCKLKIEKNRVTGRDREVVVPIYYSHGFDDVGGCIDFLVEEKHWTKTKEGVITAPEFKYKGKMDKLVQQIEEDETHRILQTVVFEVWKEIEKGCQVKRKPRYE